MATLEDTFRMMNGEAPINTNKISEEDKKFQENKSRFNGSGELTGKITRNFMDSVKDTLLEARGGTPVGGKQSTGDQLRQKNLVENGKTLVALMDAIKEDRLDSRVLANMENDIKQLTEHLSAYPEFRNIIRKRIK